MFRNGADEVIISSQQYGQVPDEDMSDFAIGFYETIYDEISEGEILQQEGSVKNWKYAGDTMNSYKTIAKFASDEKKKEWKVTYHCLANFWVLHGNVGRTVNKPFSKAKTHGKSDSSVENFNKCTRDYMDRFLKDL